jgi:hypothetical protein
MKAEKLERFDGSGDSLLVPKPGLYQWGLPNALIGAAILSFPLWTLKPYLLLFASLRHGLP